MTTVYPRPYKKDNTWYFRYTDRKGFRRKKSTQTTNKTKAQQFVREFIDLLNSTTDTEITLRELINDEPLHQGLAELVAYLELAHDGDVVVGGAGSADGLRAVVDETVEEPIRWMASNPMGERVTREARLPRVIFTR